MPSRRDPSPEQRQPSTTFSPPQPTLALYKTFVNQLHSSPSKHQTSLYSNLSESRPSSSASSTSSSSSDLSPISSTMAPSASYDDITHPAFGLPPGLSSKKSEYLLDRNIKKAYPIVVGCKGCYLYLADGRRIFDASAGAAVAAVGYGHPKVIEAMMKILVSGATYASTSFWAHEVVEDLCKEIINGTDGKMCRVYLTGSGSEAMESAIKLGRQYFYESDKQSPRVNFISRLGSYHGNTTGALSVSGHVARRAPYEDFLMKNVHHVSSCHPYRERLEGESDEEFVARKAAELEAKFQQLGPGTVIGFICEPVVGAALGCVPPPPGYLKAMRDICHKHGALFILDEVMSGMGRCGTLHAWQGEDVVPDIQTVAKGLGGGYAPIGAVLVSKKVVNRLLDGTGQFIHGQTYQAMPIQAAASLAVQRIIQDENLLENCAKQGAYLEKRLKESLGNHPNVGDIRGRGLFWGIEFVKDKETKEPFEPKLEVSTKISDLALTAPFNMTLYPGQGAAGGVNGDQILICPPYIVTSADIDLIVDTATAVITQVFSKLGKL